MFSLFFTIGVEHILSTLGLDHILFMVALAAVYQLSDWKRVLVLVTAFTIGHSLTLALATLRIISVSVKWVEFLIPVTILITCIANIVRSDEFKMTHLNYLFTLFFGLIHGLGFSASLQAMLGQGQQLALPLLGFNVGLEIGQIIVVITFLLCSFVVIRLIHVSPRDWRMVGSSVIIGMSLFLIHERIFW